jgi:hypothetical protein
MRLWSRGGGEPFAGGSVDDTLDELYAGIASLRRDLRHVLGHEPDPPELHEAAEAPEPAPLLRVWAEAGDLDSVLDQTVAAAWSMRGADGALVSLFSAGGARASVGLSAEETETLAFGPPQAGARVRALAIAYELEPGASAGPPIATALTVPIRDGRETIGFLSIFSRSPEETFYEDQAWALEALAAEAAEALEAAASPATPAVETLPAARPSLQFVLLLVAAAACLVAPVAMLAGLDSPVRVAAALALVTLAPGAAALPLFSTRSAALELGLVVGTSLGCCTLVAQLMLSAGAWSPIRATAAVAAVSLLSIGAQLRRPRPRVVPT